MLENNLHPDVAENPAELVVYGGIGKAARNWPSYHAIVRELQRLGDDETLLVQSGKPVAVFETHEAAPRVLIANSNLVPALGDLGGVPRARRRRADDVRPDDRRLLDLHRQPGDPAGDVRDVRRGRAQALRRHARRPARRHRRPRRHGRRAAAGDHDARRHRAVRRGRPAADRAADPRPATSTSAPRISTTRCARLDARPRRAAGAVDRPRRQRRRGAARARRARGVDVDIVTDQTSRPRPAQRLHPRRPDARAGRRAAPRPTPTSTCAASARARSRTSARSARWPPAGAEAFDYGNALRGLASEHGDRDAFSYPGFVPAYVRPLFCEGKGPFRWVALSGDPADIHATDRAILDLFGDQEHIARWIKLASERVQFQGLPARICWLGYGERAPAPGCASTRWSRPGEVKAPIVIGRDHLDAGSVASPQRETEAMSDGSDAVADWPLLNALINTACGASWVSIHHGGGVGMGKSIHAGQVCVADGTELAARADRARTLKADPGIGHRPPRRRRLRPGGVGGARARPADPDARVVAEPPAPRPCTTRQIAPRPTPRRHISMPQTLMCTRRRPAGACLHATAGDARDDLVRQRRAGAHAPEPGLPYLRTNRAGELALEPGGITVEHGRIAALEPDSDANIHVDATRVHAAPRARRLPHPPAVRRLARRGVRAEGHRRPVRGDRARRRRHRVLGPRAERDPRRRPCSRRRRSSPARCSRSGTTTSSASRATACRRAGELRALRARHRARRPSSRRPRPEPRCSPTPSPTATRPTTWMDEVEAMLPEALEHGERARHLRRVDRVRRSSTSTAWAQLADRERRAPSRAMSSSSRRCARSRWRSSTTRARSTTCRRSTPTTSDRSALARRAAVLLPGAEFMGAEHTRAGARR